MNDFTLGIRNISTKDFIDNYNLINLIGEPTYFKSQENPSCIDLILTNGPRSFQNYCAIVTGLSDIHLMTLTATEK